ncbi:hypothetical protein M2163_000431 [Streptomyces sp. SAI-135]|uniref:hypothetical protein n=1 Tax=unclassified Streptomyces TaxID=2593676 RepID=UPI0024767220|nr:MULTISPECIES: hypothetical protein [unclassified Streptomyces]MDH6523064.1 hypothetical protein [Streptomyces sp. SAI-090]MDH6573947.1 hypothetical protein [Streptomyces sp. SAI-117]MDH6581316.1 hypothetical protein [Streptomyces sp. SAI-133]MDH6613323.1 hypothetical protein [Streptomyces sp. SAI-135]
MTPGCEQLGYQRRRLETRFLGHSNPSKGGGCPTYRDTETSDLVARSLALTNASKRSQRLQGKDSEMP